MDTISAQTSIKNINAEAFSLAPSALITLFEIDIGTIGFNQGILSQNEINSEINTVFRFHNVNKLGNTSIFWKGKEYIACPINAEGFEISTKGALPTPKLSISVSDNGIPALSLLKDRIAQLAGDLTGAKVSRIKTFAKFLDIENFFNGVLPDGYVGDNNSEFPRDVYFIERKSLENKNTLELELSSIFDVEGLKLPARTVSSNTCPFLYRADGCGFEYNARRTSIHGDMTLPLSASPVANDRDELFSVLFSGIIPNDRGVYDSNGIYMKGDFTYITNNNINFYFVAITNNVVLPPPNTRFWVQDSCAKHIVSCQFRFGIGGSAQGGVVPGNLPFGGFFAVDRFK